MTIKITSPRAELAVLRGITHKNKKIAGTLLSAVDESYFHSPESVEIFEALKKHMAREGEVPSFRLLTEDLDISQEARIHFKDSEATIQSVEEANRATKILNKYRQARGLYELAAKIDRKLQQSKIDLDLTLEDVGNTVSKIRSKKSINQAFVHFGTNNSSIETVKDLLYNDEQEDTIPTGIKPFDEQAGGFMRGSLITIGASSGGGKCCSLETRIQLSTLVIELEDGSTIEAEPEDILFVRREGSFIQVRSCQLCEGDDIEIDPQILQELLFPDSL